MQLLEKSNILQLKVQISSTQSLKSLCLNSRRSVFKRASPEKNEVVLQRNIV